MWLRRRQRLPTVIADDAVERSAAVARRVAPADPVA
jgi:hypothetical protein